MTLELALKENTEMMRKLIETWNLTLNPKRDAKDTPDPKPLAKASVGVSNPPDATKPGSVLGTAADVKKPAAVSPQPETAAAPPASEPEVSKSETAVTYDDVKALVLRVSKDKGRDAAVAVLSGFGVTKAPELKPEQYADAVAQFKAALA